MLDHLQWFGMSAETHRPDEAALRPDPDVVAQRLEDETVIVHLRTNRIFVLNSTAARFWELVCEGHGRSEIEKRMEAEYDVAATDLRQEIDTLVSDLIREELISGRHSS